MNGGFVIWLLASVIFNFTGITVPLQSLELCPTFCVCDTWYGLQRASCTGRHLYSIHTGAPDKVQALDLSNNSISSINNFELADAGLTRLKYLNLSGNSISEIGLNAFDGLADLTVLDLSRNHLYYVLADVFIGSRNLRILKLSKNHFNAHVPKLQSSWLTELSLDSCQISHLPLDTFNGLPRIWNLDLSYNFMIQIDSVVLQTLHFLRKVTLEGNPWSCNKIMDDLHVYLRRNRIEFNTICGKTPAPKMFEKMIIRPVAKQGSHRPSTITRKTIERPKSVSKYNQSHASNEENVSAFKETTNNGTGLVNWVDNISSYWFLVAGFILGSGTSLVLSYVWLTGTFGCFRRCRHREQANDDSQRLSLLSNLWHFQDLIHNNNADLVASCPGTPPPPYREVMLRPGVYRCSSTASNLNDNGTGCRERYT